jgi:hypothetical protein
MTNGGIIGPKNNVEPYRTSGIFNIGSQYSLNKNNFWEKAIVRDGLVFWLDANNPNSYPGSGNTWFDISGTGLNATGSSPIINGALGDTQPYTTASSAILNNDNHSIFFMIQINSGAGSWSKIFGYTPVGTDRSPGIWRRPEERRLHWKYDPGSTGVDISANSLGFLGQEFSPFVWYYVGVTKNGSTLTTYLNGVSLGTETVASPKTAGESTIQLYPDYNKGDTSRLSSVKIYNRSLSASEVLQNFNAISGRFDKFTRQKTTAKGGTITYSGGYAYHTFNSSQTLSIESPGTVDYLIVGGGGGGGDRHGGGGGAGGFLSGTLSISQGSYAVTVGAGGAGGNYESSNSSPRGSGLRGQDSSIAGIGTALGGGGGGTFDGNPSGSFGSGGGGGGNNRPGIAGTSGQGSSGGSGANPGGGGGGGAGAVGGNANNGSGGAGREWPTGSGVYYAGGGGGAWGASGGPATPGGIGGGGAGAWDEATIQAGTPNTGGGGGASRSNNTATIGRPGGSGVVIVRYQI